jgi:hypothetical protein
VGLIHDRRRLLSRVISIGAQNFPRKILPCAPKTIALLCQQCSLTVPADQDSSKQAPSASFFLRRAFRACFTMPGTPPGASARKISVMSLTTLWAELLFKNSSNDNLCYVIESVPAMREQAWSPAPGSEPVQRRPALRHRVRPLAARTGEAVDARRRVARKTDRAHPRGVLNCHPRPVGSAGRAPKAVACACLFLLFEIVIRRPLCCWVNGLQEHNDSRPPSR